MSVQAKTLSGSFAKNFAKLDSHLTKTEMAHLKVGYSLFSKPWVQAPASTRRRDGLGPHFNAVSCMSCHAGMGRGAPPNIIHANDPALVFKSNSEQLYAQYGEQITPKALPDMKPEGRVKISYKTIHRYGVELLKPVYTLQNGGAALVGTRIAPHLAGLGRLQSIPAEEILKNVKNGGKVSIVDGEISRFGWKASQKDLTQQVAAAFSMDMGITNELYPHERCESGCADSIDGADEEGVEIRRDHLDMVVTLIKGIKPPAPLSTKYTQEGKEVFKKANCQSCHRIGYELAEYGLIEPYTDLLLHDMGAALSDEGALNPLRRFWRTPPLWGLGSQVLVNGHTRLLHDGRARNIEEAILWHGGAAQASIDKFVKLAPKERDTLLLFLKSL